jgi:hypothetical protein
MMKFSHVGVRRWLWKARKMSFLLTMELLMLVQDAQMPHGNYGRQKDERREVKTSLIILHVF